jgi:hypothetical protein
MYQISVGIPGTESNLHCLVVRHLVAYSAQPNSSTVLDVEPANLLSLQPKFSFAETYEFVSSAIPC